MEIVKNSLNKEHILRNKNYSKKMASEIVEIEQKRVQKLPDIFKGKWGVYFLIQRNENFAIYQKDKPSSCYEVFQIRKIDAKKSAESFNRRFPGSYNMNEVPDIKEKYPSDEDFGSIAWTYPSLEKAKDKFNFLVKSEDK